MPGYQAAIQTAACLLSEARLLYVFTADGLSAESGLPPFFADTATYQELRPRELLQEARRKEDPERAWNWVMARRHVVSQHAPNEAHRVLANWTAAHGNTFVMTGSADGLHQDAHQPELRQVAGSIWKKQCTECRIHREDRSLQLYKGFEPISRCCRTPERPSLVWQSTNKKAVPWAIGSLPTVLQGEHKKAADLVLILGGGVADMTGLGGIKAYVIENVPVIEISPAGNRFNARVFLPFPVKELLPQLLAEAEILMRRRSSR
jgi:NAD-dependent SIR2 family protein deacetylase